MTWYNPLTWFDNETNSTEQQNKKVLDTLLDSPEYNEWFLNWINNRIADVTKHIPVLDEYAKTTAAENIAEQFEKATQQLPEVFKANNITAYDVYKYLNNKLDDKELENKIKWLATQYDISKFKNIVPNAEEKLKQMWYKWDIIAKLSPEKIISEYTKELTQWTIWKQLSDLTNKWVITKKEANNTMNIMKDYIKRLAEIDLSMKKSFWDRTPEKLKSWLRNVRNLINTYLTAVVDKLKEYWWDFEKVSNDDELNQLASQIEDWLNSLRTLSSLQGIADKESVLGKIKSWAWTIMWFLNTAVQKWEEWWAELVNAITPYHVEWGNNLQERIDLADNKSTLYDKVMQWVWNTIADLVPWTVSTILWIWWVSKVAGATEKISPLLSKTINVLWTNEAINWIFNHYFDPAQTRLTQQTDMLFDIAGEAIMNPALSLIWQTGKKILGLTEKDALKKYLDDTEFIIKDKDWKQVKVKWNEVFKNLWDIEEFAKAKWISDYNAIKDLFQKYIAKLDELNKKKSWLFSPLVKITKKAVLEDINNYLKKTNSNPVLSKVLDTVIKTNNSKAIDKVFDYVSQSAKEWSESVDKYLKTANNLSDIKNFLTHLDLKKTFLKKVSNDLSVKNWDVIKIANTNPIPKDYDFKLKYNLKEGTLEDDTFSKVMWDAVEYAYKKFNWKPVSYDEFVDTIVWYFKNVWEVSKLPRTYQDLINRVVKQLIKWKKDNVLSWTKIQLFKNKKWALWLTDNTKDIVKVNTLKELYWNNPENFFIVLFHELTHRKWENFFRKVTGEKVTKRLDDIYEKAVAGVKQLIQIAEWEQKKDLEKLLKTILQSKEEFLAYVIWEMIVRWNKSDILDRLLKQLSDLWIDIKQDELNLFKEAIKKYISKRFFVDNPDKVNWVLKFAANIGLIINKWYKTIKNYFTNFVKFRDIKELEKAIDIMTEKEFNDFVRNIFGSKYLAYKNKYWIPDKDFRELVRLQLKLWLWWENGLKAAAVWNYIDDLVTASVKKNSIPDIPDYFKKLFDNDSLSKIEQLRELAIKYYNEWLNVTNIAKELWKTKLWKTATEALAFMLKSLADGKIDNITLNTAAYLWSRVVGDDVLKTIKAKEDYLSKALNYITKKLWIKKWDDSIKWLLQSMWYDIDNRYINKFKNTNFDIWIWLKNWWITKIANIDKNKAEALIKANYYRFNPIVARNLNKWLVKQYPELANLDERLYTQALKNYQYVKKIPIPVWTRKYPGIENRFLAPLVEKDGKNIIVTTDDWVKYIYDEKTWNMIKQNIPATEIIKQEYESNRYLKIKDTIDYLISDEKYAMFKNFKKALNC